MIDKNEVSCSFNDLLEVFKSIICVSAQKQQQIYKLRDHIQIINDKLNSANKKAELLKDKNVSL